MLLIVQYYAVFDLKKFLGNKNMSCCFVDQARQEFEQWIKNFLYVQDLSRLDNGDYVNRETKLAWLAWEHASNLAELYAYRRMIESMVVFTEQ